MAGIGNAGHASVGDECDIGSLFEAADELGGAHRLVVLVIAHQRLFNLVAAKENQGVAGVFCGNEVGRLEGLQRTDGDVAQVPDRGRYQAEH